MNSTRGYIFFIVFINNEKIKDYLFKKYFYFDFFKTIDQIEEEEAMSNIRSSKFIENAGITKIEKEINKNFDSNFDINKNKTKTDLTNNVEEEKKMVELDINPKNSLTKAGLINDKDDDEDDSSDDDDDKEEKKSKTTL